MASSSSGNANPSPSPPPPPTKVDPILRNALRYTISAKEYDTLHRYLISSSSSSSSSFPRVIRQYVPPPRKFRSIVHHDDDGGGGGDSRGGVDAVRASLRVFIATYVGLRVWERVIRLSFLEGGRGRVRGRYGLMEWMDGWMELFTDAALRYLDRKSRGGPSSFRITYVDLSRFRSSCFSIVCFSVSSPVCASISSPGMLPPSVRGTLASRSL